MGSRSQIPECDLGFLLYHNLMATTSEFKAVCADTVWSDNLYRFLQVIFHLYPEDAFHHLISSVSKEQQTDEEIYTTIQKRLPEIKPFLSELTYALPALKKQKREITRQVLELLGNKTTITGYLEIGSSGRYISELRKKITVSGNIYLTNDVAPNNSVADIFERGGIAKIGKFIPMNEYRPFSDSNIQTGSIDLILCPIGLHHCPLERLDDYLQSIHRILRTGGVFIMRDHDVRSPEMATFVSLVHTVFNLGLNIPWRENKNELRIFRPIDEWETMISSIGFAMLPRRILQDKDPSENTLLLFKKAGT